MILAMSSLAYSDQEYYTEHMHISGLSAFAFTSMCNYVYDLVGRLWCQRHVLSTCTELSASAWTTAAGLHAQGDKAVTRIYSGRGCSLPYLPSLFFLTFPSLPTLSTFFSPPRSGPSNPVRHIQLLMTTVTSVMVMFSIDVYRHEALFPSMVTIICGHWGPWSPAPPSLIRPWNFGRPLSWLSLYIC